MPRRAKTLDGAPAMPIAPVTGQNYGDAAAQEQMQRLMPAPQNAPVPGASALAAPTARPSAAPAAPVPAGPASPAGQPAPSFDQAHSAAQAMSAGPGLFTLPTQRPHEPVTAGLPSGPGPGPEALQGSTGGSPTMDVLRRLSVQTGDPYFAQLAARAGR